MSYIYRREDTGELIEVGFDQMMEQKDGYITLHDGVLARRCVGLEVAKYGGVEAAKYEAALGGKAAPIVSDALGFPYQQLQDFEADRVKHGFTGVEFTKDPHVPEFYQVRISSQAEWARYIAHRGMTDRNGANGGGATLTPDQFQRTTEMVERAMAEKFPKIPILESKAS